MGHASRLQVPAHRAQGALADLLLVPFADCTVSPCNFYGFPTEPMEKVRAIRRRPLPQLGFAAITGRSRFTNQPSVSAGSSTGPTTPTSEHSPKQAADWGHWPFFLRFDWEMNGFWFPWNEGVNGNKPGEFVAAWRHVHDIFTEVGRHQRDLGLVPERRLHQRLNRSGSSTRATPTSTGPASTASTGATRVTRPAG